MSHAAEKELSVEQLVESAPRDVPNDVKQLLKDLQKQLNTPTATLEGLQQCYEELGRFGEKEYKDTAWPRVEAIGKEINQQDNLFKLLYTEYTLRHLHSKIEPQTAPLKFYVATFENYLALFEHILKLDKLNFDLPNQWTWDLVDEFVSQFEAFCHHQKDWKESDLAEIYKKHPNLWSVATVLNTLERLVSKSEIQSLLPTGSDQEHAELESHKYADRHLFIMLGYWSLIGLCRVNCLLGDYFSAIESVSKLSVFGHKRLFFRITGSLVSLYYYLGFAFLMVRRYMDAARCITTMARNKGVQQKISKQIEKSYGLLAIATNLYSQRIEAQTHTIVREKFSDKINRMQRGDENAFEELFRIVCPKFVQPAQFRVADDIRAAGKRPLDHQVKMFMREVKQQLPLVTCRSLLKLYASIQMSKLATLLDTDEKTVATSLMCVKHKARQLLQQTTAGECAKWIPCSDVDFQVNKQLINVADHKPQRHYGDYFVRQLSKLMELEKNLVQSRNLTE